MIETIIRDYLTGAQPLPVLFEHQAGLEEFFILEKTGGGETNHIRSSMLTIQAYGRTKARAAQLCEEVVGLMLGAVQLDAISSVDLNSAYDFTDTEAKAYRYQAVFDIVHY